MTTRLGDLIPDALAESFTNISELAAFRNFTQEQERESRKLRLSRMSFFRDALRIQGSVLPRIWPSVVVVVVFSTIIAAADLLGGRNWRTSSAVIAPLSVVVGLLIVFRNSTSYDRWQEGRKQFQDAMSTVRSLARIIWLNVDIDAPLPERAREAKVAVPSHATRLEHKKRAIRLLVLFLYAAKHHLRGEHGLDYEDYQSILPADLRRKWSDSENALIAKRKAAGPSADSDVHSTSLRPLDTDIETSGRESWYNSQSSRRSGMSSLLSETTPLRHEEPRRLADGSKPYMTLPLLALFEVGSYSAGARKSGMLEGAGPAGYNQIHAMLTSLTLELGGMERICIGIPTVYGIHLKQATMLYLLALPLTLVQELSWRMIPFVGLVAMTLIGLEGISSEVENPWGDDPSDHPLDLFCAEVHHEVEHMMSRMPDPVAWE